jgi:FdrA protein
MPLKVEIRPGTYFDSIVLMQLQRKLAALPGIEDAGVVMATPANKELLEGFELLSPEGVQAGPDDLLIVVKSAEARFLKHSGHTV